MQHRLSANYSSVGDNIRLAVAAILGSNLAFSLSDAAIKLISANFVLWQIFVIRSVIAIPLLIAVISLWFPSTSLAPRQFGWVALRSLMLTLMLIAYLSSLPHLPLGVAAVTFYTLPIFITLFAALFIGDRIGLMGWTSVLLGFRRCSANPQAHAQRLQRVRTPAASLGRPVRLGDDSDPNEMSRGTPPNFGARCQFLVHCDWAFRNAPDRDGRRIYRPGARHILPLW